MDLTTNDSSNNWSTKKLFVVIASVIVIMLLIVIFLLRTVWGSNGSLINHEAGMPAIKVRVLNGCGYVRLASDYAHHISAKNIEVVELGDTPRPIYDKSVIVVRREDEVDLQRLQKMTGIKRFTYVLSDAAKTDFDIIIGRDYEEYMK